MSINLSFFKVVGICIVAFLIEFFQKILKVWFLDGLIDGAPFPFSRRCIVIVRILDARIEKDKNILPVVSPVKGITPTLPVVKRHDIPINALRSRLVLPLLLSGSLSLFHLFGNFRKLAKVLAETKTKLSYLHLADEQESKTLNARH